MTTDSKYVHPTAGTGRSGRFPQLFWSLAPAMLVILVLFGGGLALGMAQALGHLPGAAMDTLTAAHFVNVLNDPDFARSLGLTLYISLTSTAVAAIASVALAMGITRWAAESRLVHFLLQIPLTVPHLVIAISTLFLLAPSGLISRVLSSVGLVENASSFPLLVNDRFCIGIMAVYVWKEIPFITFMLLSVLKNLGPELLDAAATLKASKLQRFRYVILPIIGPSLGGAGLIVFAFTFGAFEVPYLLGQSYPLTMPVWSYKNYSDIDLLARPEGIATGIVICIIVMAAVMFSHLLMQQGRKRGLL